VQGGSISPLLANIYLHYVFDLWFSDAVMPHSGSVEGVLSDGHSYSDCEGLLRRGSIVTQRTIAAVSHVLLPPRAPSSDDRL
jgi:hypothetical protein